MGLHPSAGPSPHAMTGMSGNLLRIIELNLLSLAGVPKAHERSTFSRKKGY